MTKKPSYRFAGYTESWEEKRLGEISSRVKGNDGRMDLPTLTISAGQGWLDQRERFSGNIAGKEQKNYTLLRIGELSYNHGNSKLAKYGVVFQLNNYTEALVPKVYHSFKMIDGRSGTFFEYLFATKIPDRELSKLVSSGARMDGLLNITYDDFMSIKLTFPKNNEEQTAIGSYFQDIDQLISLQQRKLEVLKEQKRTYLKLLFPAKGQTKPAFRFAGFEDEWKEVKLGEVCSIKGGNAWKSEHYSTDGKYLVVTISNVKGNEYIDDTYGNRIDTVESQFILEQGDILISLTGNVGRVSKMTEVAAVLNQRVGKLTTNQSNNFLFTLLSNRNFEKEMVLSSQGAAQANISNNDVLNYKTSSLPSLNKKPSVLSSKT